MSEKTNVVTLLQIPINNTHILNSFHIREVAYGETAHYVLSQSVLRRRVLSRIGALPIEGVYCTPDPTFESHFIMFMSEGKSDRLGHLCS